MKILVVEDEPFMAEALADGLRREGMAVDVASDGDQALEKIVVSAYDVVLLDRDIPRVPGDVVCRAIADQRPETRILMVTAAGEVGDRVAGLQLGADDYLPKPFAFLELVARVRALGRRPAARRPPVLVRGDVRLDSGARRAWRGTRELPLTRKELAVLEVLVAADGSVVSAEELLERVWDEHIDPFTSVVRVTMSTLRRKMGDPPLIETLPGQGYRL
ncbi:response regulator transcription factor [Blastococcus sp. TF02A-26]|uniref:response regulator transcription factor n=1 Tax=Blastococcus sp. TF02A-26 TaxID=2250577 RepID=UPI000DE87ACC|nr:response regulator transcription factor [Blastococcus sp. TF02A-26]RBY85175.1 DNA-binding response regulator [Blastococcus sp. TF02A-26]